MCKRCICPVCRGVVLGLPDFHAIGGVTVHFHRHLHAGLVLTSAPDGVRVKAVDASDAAAHAGLRVNDLITHINGLVLTSSEDGVSLFDRAAEVGASLHCAVHRPPRPPVWKRAWTRMWSRFSTVHTRRRPRRVRVVR